MSGILGEYTEVFLEESQDQVQELNSNLLLLEREQKNKDVINNIFRAAHSLKSSAAFVGLNNLSELAHKMENLLHQIREDKIQVTSELVNLLFECFDLIKEVILSLENGEKVNRPYTEMIQKIESYNSHSNINHVTKIDHKNIEIDKDQKTTFQFTFTEEEKLQLQEKIEKASDKVYQIIILLRNDTPMKLVRFSLIIESLKKLGEVFKTSFDLEQKENAENNELGIVFFSNSETSLIHQEVEIDLVESVSIDLFNLEVIASSNKSKSSIEETKKTQQEFNQNSEIQKNQGKVNLKNIKVSSEKLDQIMNNVGELVITNSSFQSIYEELSRSFGEEPTIAELKSKIDLFNRIAKELQSGIMNVRMVPIGTVFQRFSRLVRDLAIGTNKKVNLTLRGENTELDKKVVDAISEPLMHLIRNSIDHGIESLEDRIKAGKSEVGEVELSAYQLGSNIAVEIKDDGKGLDRDKILQKAINQGLYDPNLKPEITDEEVYQFIFAPGFSTAEKITDISGRGVGMNVVNTLVEDFKGKILIQSEKGIGTSFSLLFPQALSIIPSILTLMEEEVYAFSLSEVLETIKISTNDIKIVNTEEVIDLRGEPLPIYRLNHFLGLADKAELVELPVIIVQYKNKKVGFIVDHLIGKHETVIKSLEKNFHNINGIIGASITGDGTIIIILDIPGVIKTLQENHKTNANPLQYQLEKMKKSADLKFSMMDNEDTILKTNNPTNIYNTKLKEMFKKDSKKGFVRKPKIDSNKSLELDMIEKKEEKIKEEISISQAKRKEEDLRKSVNKVNKMVTKIDLKNEISDSSLKKLENAINSGMVKSSEVLSQLLGVFIKIFVPKILIHDTNEDIYKEVKFAKDKFFAIRVGMEGALNGNTVLMFSISSASKILKDVLQKEISTKNDELDFDSLSALKEISNIVCASVMNSLSNQTGTSIMPKVPEFLKGTFHDVVEKVRPRGEQYLSMLTEFEHENSALIGLLLFFPDTEDLVNLMPKIK